MPCLLQTRMGRNYFLSVWEYCLRPDEDILKKVKERFGMLIAPYYVLHMRNALGKKHGEQPWQVHPWKAKDA